MICPQCDNRGYRKMLITPQMGAIVTDRKEIMTFCGCESGRAFRLISVEMRLEDLERVVEALKPSLRQVRDWVIAEEPRKAEHLLLKIEEQLDQMVDKIKKSLPTPI